MRRGSIDRSPWAGPSLLRELPLRGKNDCDVAAGATSGFHGSFSFFSFLFCVSLTLTYMLGKMLFLLLDFVL
jgi:hypothetical protein